MRGSIFIISLSITFCCSLAAAIESEQTKTASETTAPQMSSENEAVSQEEVKLLREELERLRVELEKKADKDELTSLQQSPAEEEDLSPPEDEMMEEEGTLEGIGVQIHGYGNWYGGWTSANVYLSGNPDMAYHSFDFALAPIANPVEPLIITAQIHLTHAIDSHGSFDVELDTAFAEWTFNDYFKFRVGRSMVPFGLYSLIFDVGTLRPFDYLPQGVYGPSGTIPAYYNGIGFSGAVRGNSGWGLVYDLYGGEMVIEYKAPFSHFADHEEEEEQDEHDHEHSGYEPVSHMFGLKLTIETALDGLIFGGAFNYGHAEQDISEIHLTMGGHLQYMGYGLVVRAEYLHHRHVSTDEKAEEEHGHADHIDAFYAEASYLLTEHLQVAARYDFALANLGKTDISEASSLVDHRDLAFSINYHFVPSVFVLKLAYHYVYGNLLAHPGSGEEMDETIHGSGLETTSHLVSLGASFSF